MNNCNARHLSAGIRRIAVRECARPLRHQTDCRIQVSDPALHSRVDVASLSRL